MMTLWCRLAFLTSHLFEHFGLVFELGGILRLSCLFLQLSQLLLIIVELSPQQSHLHFFSFELDDKLFKGKLGLVAAFLVTFTLQRLLANWLISH